MQLMQDVIGDLAGSPEPVELKLFSRDHAAAAAPPRRSRRRIEPTPGPGGSLRRRARGRTPSCRVVLDPAAGRAARAHPGGRCRPRLGPPSSAPRPAPRREPDRLVPIRVRLPDSVRFQAAALSRVSRSWGPAAGFRWPSSAGGRHRRRERAAARKPPAVHPCHRPHQRAEPRQRHARRRRAAVARVPLPRRRHASRSAGSTPASRQSFRELLGVLALAIGAVLLRAGGPVRQLPRSARHHARRPARRDRRARHAHRNRRSRSTSRASWG